MPEYQKMYSILCGAISDALDNFDNKTKVKKILEDSLLQTEEIYINSDLSKKTIRFDFTTTSARL